MSNPIIISVEIAPGATVRVEEGSQIFYTTNDTRVGKEGGAIVLILKQDKQLVARPRMEPPKPNVA